MSSHLWHARFQTRNAILGYWTIRIVSLRDLAFYHICQPAGGQPSNSCNPKLLVGHRRANSFNIHNKMTPTAVTQYKMSCHLDPTWLPA